MTRPPFNVLMNRPENASDDTPIILNEDTQALVLAKIKEASDALSFVAMFVRDGEITVSSRYNGLSLAESHLNSVKKLLGADADDEQKQEADRKSVRAANMENHRLREEMAKGVTAEAVGLKLNAYKNIVYKWWKNLGFSYCKGSFNAHSHGGGFNVEFTTNIDTHLDCIEREESPISSRKIKDEKVQSISETLDLYVEGRYDHAVVDTPRNRAWIFGELKARFPSIQIHSIESRSISGSDLLQIMKIEAYLQIEDIDLPEAE